MKTKLLAICLILATLFCITSCGAKPKLNFEKAQKNLEDKDYMVMFSDDEDDLKPGMAAYLSASDGDENRLVMIEYKDLKSAKLAYKEYKLSIESKIEEKELEIKELKNILKKYDADLDSEAIDNCEDEIKELQDEIKDLKKETLYGRSGKIFWYGTKDAVKASKGK